MGGNFMSVKQHVFLHGFLGALACSVFFLVQLGNLGLSGMAQIWWVYPLAAVMVFSMVACILYYGLGDAGDGGKMGPWLL